MVKERQQHYARKHHVKLFTVNLPVCLSGHGFRAICPALVMGHQMPPTSCALQNFTFWSVDCVGINGGHFFDVLEIGGVRVGTLLLVVVSGRVFFGDVLVSVVVLVVGRLVLLV